MFFLFLFLRSFYCLLIAGFADDTDNHQQIPQI